MMTQETIELIIRIVITIIGLLFTYVIVPYIKNKIDQDKLNKLQQYIEYAVRYAEQLYTESQNKEKKEYVYNYILHKANEIGLHNLTEEDLDIMVEGVVNLVKHDN